MPRHGRIYDAADGRESLDDLWTKAEGGLPKLLEALLQAERGGPIPSAIFILIMAPYLANLLARQPQVFLPSESLDEHGEVVRHPDVSDLMGSNSGQEELDHRYGLMGILSDMLVHRLRWSVAVAPTDAPWISTDRGAVWLPGHGFGLLLVPLSPRYAVIVGSGDPTYVLGDPSVLIRARLWSAEDVWVANDVLALTAPREAYASEHQQAEHVLTLWDSSSDAASTREGVEAKLLSGFVVASGPWPLMQGRYIDPRDSWLRFLVANHQYGCSCAAGIASTAEPVSARALAEFHHRLVSAEMSLRGPQGLMASDDPRRIAVVMRRGKTASADRGGFQIHTAQNPEPRSKPFDWLRN